MRADCRCENMAFVCFLLFVALRGLHAVHLGGGGLFEEVLCCSSWVDFETVFTLFFRRHCPFRSIRDFPLPLLRGATNFREIAVKIAKINEKVCAHHFVEIAERLEENSTEIV